MRRLLVLSAFLVGCGSTVHPSAVAPAPASGTSKAPNTPICAFYGTTVAVGLLALHPGDPGVTIARLRPRWPRVVRAAELGGRVRWPGPAAEQPRAAYALFLGDLRRASAAIDGNDLPAFQAALASAKPHLVTIGKLAKRSHLVCKVVSADGSTMTFGG